MKRLRVGIIGCGNIFPMHAYPAMKREEVELIAVCDNKEDRAKEKAGELGCKYYVDYKEMIDKEKLDVVHICTPHYLHAPMSIYAANAGANVLTEKPMAIKLEDAKAMLDAANENDILLGVIFQNRYNPGAKLIKNTLETGQLGKIISSKLAVTWNRSDDYYSKSDWKGTWEMEGGGVIIDQAIHTMDLMRWFIDSEIDYVDATISNRAHEIIQVEDSAEGVVVYKNGVVSSFYTINYYGYDAPVEIELHCEKGIVKMEADKAIIMFADGKQLIADKNPNESFDYGNVKSYWGVSHVKQINNYYDSLEKGIKPYIAAEDAYKTQKLICTIYESGKELKRVKC
ncbi:MAG: gfo/Idh/MocA family oxidoreductase [Firmicutes bacterium HGW-Firmicutes-1]|jgi:predicted dehydrogenase|nr:MAG: gfo/Idh/MocA family oxidoreductase [Firmicutes bacterium HGW-Firmicutes-1]